MQQKKNILFYFFKCLYNMLIYVYSAFIEKIKPLGADDAVC